MHSSGSIHSVSSADSGENLPQSIRTEVTNVEAEIVLERMLGVPRADILHMSNKQVAERISRRMFLLINNTRTSLRQEGLAHALTRSIDKALERIVPDGRIHNGMDPRRVEAIIKGVYEAVPQDIFDQYLVQTMPVTVAVENGTEISRVRLNAVPLGGVNRNIIVDFSHPFWKLHRFTSAADIERLLDHRMPTDVGIEGYATQLTLADAHEISIFQFNPITIPQGADRKRVVALPAPGGNVDVNLKVHDLVNARTSVDAPAGLQNRFICEFTDAELRDLFNYLGLKGDRPYWKKFVEAGGKNPADATAASNFLDEVMLELETAYPSLAAGNALGAPAAPLRLLDVHREMNIQQQQALEFLEKLRTGSENVLGAAVAASIALHNSQIRRTVLANTDAVKAAEEVKKERAKIEVIGLIGKLRDIQVHLQIEKMPGGLDATFASLEKEWTDLKEDQKKIDPAVAAHWDSDYGKSGALNLPNTLLTLPLKNEARKQIAQQIREVEEEIARYHKLEVILKRLQRAANEAKIYDKSGTLKKYVNASGDLIGLEMKKNFDVLKAADDIRDEVALESEEDIKKEIEKLEAKRKKAKDGGETGDVLQQKVFEEKFKEQGLSPYNRQRAANNLYARTLMDNEFTDQMNTMLGEIFPVYGHEHADKKSWRVVQNFAEVMGVSTRRDQRWYKPFIYDTVYQWQSIRHDYPRLITAYFALKQLHEGKGPAYLHCVGSPVVRAQMRAIADVIKTYEVEKFVDDFGNDLSDDDRARLGSRKGLTKETLRKILTGDTPSGYTVGIDRVLGITDHSVDPWRRKTKETAKWVGKGILGTTDAVGGKTISVAKKTAKWTWENKWSLAATAAFFAAGGILGPIALGMANDFHKGGAVSAPAHP